MRSPKPLKQLSWADRFAIIEAARKTFPELTDDDIRRVFSIDVDEYAMACDCLADGTFKPNIRIDAEFYLPYFRGEEPIYPEAEERSRTLPVPVSKAPATPEERALFASRPQRRGGRKGNNIGRAFAAIPTVAVPAEEFAEKQRVSMAVLRQYKRFDKHPGQVSVRKDKETGIIMIWRDVDV